MTGRLASLPFQQVTITGAFWSERLACILDRTVPSQHRMLEEHGILESLTLPDPPPSLRIPPNHHDFTTQIFWDSDVGKWIEAASYALSFRRDARVEAQIEAIVDALEAAQAPDGYLNCWYLGREPENRWTNLRDNHELYCAGHLLEGAVAYLQATGRDRLLRIMELYIAHIAQVFGPGEGQRRGYPGHQEIELALIRAWRATGTRAHLDLARYFIDQRGQAPHYFDAEARARGENPADFWAKTYEYNQSHQPVREQTKVVGHAVRAIYMYAAMADLALVDGDPGLAQACRTLWRDITERRMYVTGGFGPSASNEGFTADYDLPNETAYAETCASVAMVFWASRMLNLELDGQYADVLETALYNTVLAGLARDGEHYFYDNKLASDGSHRRWRWHPCPCCTMNASRLLASVAGYFASASEDTVALHLYGGARFTLPLAGTQVTVDETSAYPWDGRIRVTVTPEAQARFTVALRIPGWASGATLSVGGAAVPVTSERGYVRLTRDWAATGEVIDLDLPMPPERLHAHPLVRQDQGRVALRRGPLVYCFEQHDNAAPVHLLRLPPEAPLTVADSPILGGIKVLTAPARRLETETWGTTLYRTEPPAASGAEALAIPYFLWGNRGPNPMTVWPLG